MGTQHEANFLYTTGHVKEKSEVNFCIGLLSKREGKTKRRLGTLVYAKIKGLGTQA